MFNILHEITNERSIIFIDFNAHNKKWCKGKRNKRRNDVVEYINLNNMRVINNISIPTSSGNDNKQSNTGGWG